MDNNRGMKPPPDPYYQYGSALVQEVRPELCNRLRRRWPRPGDKWHLDKVFIRIQGVQHYLWRAVDQDGVVLDILVQERDAKAASASSDACSGVCNMCRG
jgi:hypothetical protein